LVQERLDGGHRAQLPQALGGRDAHLAARVGEALQPVLERGRLERALHARARFLEVDVVVVARDPAAPVEGALLAHEVEHDRPADEVRQHVLANVGLVVRGQPEQARELAILQARFRELAQRPARQPVDDPALAVEVAVAHPAGQPLLEPQRELGRLLRQTHVHQLVRDRAGLGRAQVDARGVAEQARVARMEGTHARRSDAGHLLHRAAGHLLDVPRAVRGRLAVPDVDRHVALERPEGLGHGAHGGLDRAAVAALFLDRDRPARVQRPARALVEALPGGAGRERDAQRERARACRQSRVRMPPLIGTEADLQGIICEKRNLHIRVGWSARPGPRAPATMASFRLELDEPNNIVLVMVTEDDGTEHDYQFDFDARSGRYEFSERDLLERDFGAEWVEDMDTQVRETIQRAVPAEGRMSSRRVFLIVLDSLGVGAMPDARASGRGRAHARTTWSELRAGSRRRA
jgi:hypothetical protein